MSAFYLTGTDTDAGKTLATCALLQAFRAAGKTAVGMKPVASGCVQSAEGWRNDDAVRLLANSDPNLNYELVNLFALPDATAPEIAAARAGITVTLPAIEQAFRELQARADIVLIEGVGGWMAPLATGLDQCELARRCGAPVILVVGMRLGCINHARLSARAIQADGCELRGWIANAIDPDLAYADEYFRQLSAAMPAPCLGRLPFMQVPDPKLLAAHLRLPDARAITAAG
jgi:dethiobiotin synthetase